MNILYIYDADYPWDIRVEKICTSLCVAGYEVHIAARNINRLQVYENINGLHIHRIKPFHDNKINYMASFPAFFNPIWTKFLNHIIGDKKIDLIIVRDLPMAIAGIWAGEKNNIPVIFDMAEDYVSMIRDIWQARKFQGLNIFIRNPYLAKQVERYVLKKVDHILVVIEEAIEVIKKGGGNIDEVTIVSNTPVLELFNISHINQDNNLNLIKKRFSVIYTGGIQFGRGIQTVLDAIPEIIMDIPDFLFVVVGDGYGTEYFLNYIKAKDLANHVLWVGWVEHKLVYEYIKQSSVGVIPHLVTEHVNTTIPNKIFDYMGFGVPVLATNAKPLKRIVEIEKCGLTFNSGDSKDFIRVIKKVYNTNIDFGQNGIKAVHDKYNWKYDEERLLNVIQSYH